MQSSPGPDDGIITVSGKQSNENMDPLGLQLHSLRRVEIYCTYRHSHCNVAQNTVMQNKRRVGASRCHPFSKSLRTLHGEACSKICRSCTEKMRVRLRQLFLQVQLVLSQVWPALESVAKGTHTSAACTVRAMTGAGCAADMHINPQPILNILEKNKVSRPPSQWASPYKGCAPVQACEQCGYRLSGFQALAGMVQSTLRFYCARPGQPCRPDGKAESAER